MQSVQGWAHGVAPSGSGRPQGSRQLLYIYIASGNPIQPAPVPVIKHPAPAQAGRVSSPSGLARGAYLAGGEGCHRAGG